MAGFAESSEAWTKTWLDMQRQYVDAWLQLSGREAPWHALSPLYTGGGNPWSGAFEQWSKLFGQAMPTSTKDVSTRLFEMGKSYLDMSESFWQSLRAGAGTQDWLQQWQDAMRKVTTQAGTLSGFPGGAADPWSGFANLWGLPLSNWNRMAFAFSPFPGEMEKAMREADTVSSPLTQTMRRALSLPPVGYTREWQEDAQAWGQLALEYANSVQAFSLLLGKVVERALAMFGQKLQEKMGAGETFDGLRAIYNLWIDCGEDAYAELVASADFPRLQAEMVNALMRLKRQEQRIVEEVMTAMNVPTRQELDTTHKRVHDLQRQVRRLQDALDDLTEPEAEPAPQARQTPSGKKTSTAKRRG